MEAKVLRVVMMILESAAMKHKEKCHGCVRIRIRPEEAHDREKYSVSTSSKYCADWSV